MNTRGITSSVDAGLAARKKKRKKKEAKKKEKKKEYVHYNNIIHTQYYK